MRLPGLLAVMALAVPALPAQEVRSGRLLEGTLSFDGRATMGDFTGTTSTVSGEMTGGAGLEAVRGWVEAPVNTLKTGNGRRDRDLNKSMESDRYPSMRFELSGVTPGVTRGDTTAATLAGAFTIHGVTRPENIPATIIREGNRIRVRSAFPMNLEDYQIGGLSKMLGLLKMHPDITVRIDLLFEQ